MKCMTCGDRYAADPVHDYGYCSEWCEINDYTAPETDAHATLDDVRHAHTVWRAAHRVERRARTMLADKVKAARRMNIPYSIMGKELGLSRQRLHQLASE